VRIFRPEPNAERRAPFQREWEPVFSPEPWPRRNDCRTDRAPRLPRIPRRYHAAVVGTALTVALTAVVSFGMTIKTAGLSPDAPMRWLAAWQLACLIAVPARFVLLPLVSKAAGLLVEPPAA
jgi:hypothetical protein